MTSTTNSEQSLSIQPGDRVRIPKGTLIHTVGKDPKPAGKTYTVIVHRTYPAVEYTERVLGDVVTVRKPAMVVWAGPGGYWSQADIDQVQKVSSDNG